MWHCPFPIKSCYPRLVLYLHRIYKSLSLAHDQCTCEYQRHTKQNGAKFMTAITSYKKQLYMRAERFVLRMERMTFCKRCLPLTISDRKKECKFPNTINGTSVLPFPLSLSFNPSPASHVDSKPNHRHRRQLPRPGAPPHRLPSSTSLSIPMYRM